MSSNEQRRAHFHQVAKAKRLVGETVRDLAIAQKIGSLKPSVVTATWFVKDRRRRDVDSLGPLIKASLDGLVQAGIFEDDQSDFVKAVTLKIDKSDMKNPRIEILIEEVVN